MLFPVKGSKFSQNDARGREKLFSQANLRPRKSFSLKNLQNLFLLKNYNQDTYFRIKLYYRNWKNMNLNFCVQFAAPEVDFTCSPRVKNKF